ncbi:hypothetical protein [Microbulbifer thermotolerans]|uniref:Uncharacterized protein n=1 Tax=Microbulbifer thermotolerans TaxID=252514 RepID=A0A143HP24_MICTH|nr:hypothetical protein [Microbulbifer thermotolerans]AMX03463.1 hypothetical protein A3224_13555 [Microbulbifer thermotolerans]
MSKVYGVFFTRTGNILFGFGGKSSGNNRKGAHLPGGSAKGKKKAQTITTYKIRKTLLDELGEEFGASAKEKLEIEIDRYNAIPFSKILDGHMVYIVLCEISSETERECCGTVRDAEKPVSYYDEPFSEIRSLHILDAYNNEIDIEQTWFKAALEVLDMYHFNGACIQTKRYA